MNCNQIVRFSLFLIRSIKIDYFRIGWLVVGRSITITIDRLISAKPDQLNWMDSHRFSQKKTFTLFENNKFFYIKVVDSKQHWSLSTATYQLYSKIILIQQKLEYSQKSFQVLITFMKILFFRESCCCVKTEQLFSPKLILK